MTSPTTSAWARSSSTRSRGRPFALLYSRCPKQSEPCASARAGRLRHRRGGGADPRRPGHARAVARGRRRARAPGRADAGPRATRTPTPTRRSIELASPVGARRRRGRRRAQRPARTRARGGRRRVIGAGIHPDGAFGDVVHVDEPRYAVIVDQLQGLIRRTPTCALHVHVGMPDAATAIRVFNGLREQLPLLQALAANSPFWHGRDSGPRHRARAALPRLPARRHPARLRLLRRLRRDRRGRRRRRRPARLHVPVVGHPPAPAAGHGRGARDGRAVGAVVRGRAGRARPRAGARRGARAPRTPGRRARCSWRPRSPPRATGCGARLPLDGALRPVPEVARAALERARPHAAELGSGDALRGHRADPRRGQRRRPPARRARPRRDAGAAGPARGAEAEEAYG